MTKDAVATMGGLLPDDSGGRDAVHVAVFSAVSDEKLFAGQEVAVLEQGKQGEDTKVSAKSGLSIGLVDPFLKVPVMPGERVWVFLYPRTITALSHRWSHPAFEAAAGAYAPPATKLASEEWLRDFVERSNCPRYDVVMAKAALVADGDNETWDSEYLHFGSDASGEIPDEFWDHVEVVLGRKVKGKRPTYFSCSC